MKNTPSNEEQSAKIPREADAAPLADVAEKYGISDATIYGNPKRYG